MAGVAANYCDNMADVIMTDNRIFNADIWYSTIYNIDANN